MIKLSVQISVIGSTGMLGNNLVRYLKSQNVEVLEIFRTGSTVSTSQVNFDITRDSARDLVRRLPENSTVVNASGLIKHRINQADPASMVEAIRVNSIFPVELALECIQKGIRVIQIGTDCVFSGNSGPYNEKSIPDASDLYGITKLAGEKQFENVLTLRSSMIGIETSENLELLNWVVTSAKNSTLNGFTNHFWNGVTVLQISRIILGLSNEKEFNFGTFHLTPADAVSKYELIELICKKWNRNDIRVTPVETNPGIDRRLASIYPSDNSKLWELGGYYEAPTVERMLTEYINWLGLSEHQRGN
jgi:dTDP-4-dehydrorhamnose reductase